MFARGDDRRSATRRSRPPARLGGVWLALARAGWLAVAVACLGLFVAAILARHAAPGRPFSGALWGAITVGFTAQSYTAYAIARDGLTATAYCIVAMLIFRHKSAERGPLVISALLLLCGTV